MTYTSRPTPALPLRTRARQGFPAWHIACILAPLSGCIYFGPIPDLAEGNLQPEIKSQSFERGDTIVVGVNGQQVFVVAQDPEDDPVAFVWSYVRGPIIGDAEEFVTPPGAGGPSLQGSYVTLPYDPTLDGEELQVEVFDEHNDTQAMSWPLEVL